MRYVAPLYNAYGYVMNLYSKTRIKLLAACAAGVGRRGLDQPIRILRSTEFARNSVLSRKGRNQICACLFPTASPTVDGHSHGDRLDLRAEDSI